MVLKSFTRSHEIDDWKKTVRALSSGVVSGVRGHDGIFEEHPRGRQWLAFDEQDDVVFWCPVTDQIATAEGRAFALNEMAIENAGTYSLDASLVIHASPQRWILAGGTGIFVLNWRNAFDKLRNSPRISIDRSLLQTYRQHMKPRRMPEVAIITEKDQQLAG